MEKQMMIARFLAGQIEVEDMSALCRADPDLLAMLLVTVQARLERVGESG